MKKLISLVVILLFYSVKSQSYISQNGFQPTYSSTLSVSDIAGDNAVFGVKSENSNKVLKYDEIVGSPYFDKQFYLANVASDYGKTLVRYNSFLDEVEFKEGEKTLVLPKEDKFSKIQMFSPKNTLILLKTNDDFSGYFFELLNGKNSLYKKNKTKFIDAVIALNAYATDRPAIFKTMEPLYYIRTETGYIKKPKNSREIIQAFPNKKDELTKFFKENKTKFNNEADLIKLVNFLNQ